MHFFCSSKILKDIGQSLNEQSTTEWITGGAFGSRSASLVFKTSALTRQLRDDDDSDDSTNASTSSEKCRFPPVADAKTTSPVTRETLKRLVAPNFDIRRKCGVKVSGSVSSSSENSLSGASEEPSDLDTDNVEKSNVSDKRMNRLTVDHTKSGFNHVEDGEREKAESPTGSEHDDPDASTEKMPAALLKMTYKFTNTETKLLKRILSSHGLKEAKEYQKFNLLWTGVHLKPDILRSLLPYQRVNHFPR